MKLDRIIVNLFFMAFIISMLVACGPGNNVRLLTPPAKDTVNLPSPNAVSICVVSFKDSRNDLDIVGVRRNGSPFVTKGNVASWISRTLADELARKGFRITFTTNVEQARSSGPQYIVIGDVKEVWLKEQSSTEITSQMRVTCTLAGRKGILWKETCNSSQSRSALPSDDFADVLLKDTLVDLIKPLAQKITASVEAKK